MSNAFQIPSLFQNHVNLGNDCQVAVGGQNVQGCQDYHQKCTEKHSQGCSQDYTEPSEICLPWLDKFQSLQVLGTGTCGQVFLVKKKVGTEKGKLYATKTMNNAAILENEEGLKRYHMEC